MEVFILGQQHAMVMILQDVVYALMELIIRIMNFMDFGYIMVLII